MREPSSLLPGFMFGDLSSLLVFLFIVLWIIVIKGYALWVAARSEQKWWFIPLLVINTLGIIELVYLVWFSPKGSNLLSPALPEPAKATTQE